MALAVFEPEAVAVHLEDVNVVGKAIEQCASKVRGSLVRHYLWALRCPTSTTSFLARVIPV